MTSPASMICVLGMHRSGTSLATRALHLLGVSLGPEAHLMRPREDNPLGFFEHQPLTDLNDEILWQLGGCWHTPPALQEGWAASPALDNFRERARLLLDEDFGRLPLWGWKDPRTCLTLPFWLPLLPPARFVICLRNPLDVARSLQARDGFDLERGVRLWVDYLGSALRATTYRGCTTSPSGHRRHSSTLKSRRRRWRTRERSSSSGWRTWRALTAGSRPACACCCQNRSTSACGTCTIGGLCRDASAAPIISDSLRPPHHGSPRSTLRGPGSRRQLRRIAS